jgi:uncharacterized Zn finger protein
MKKSISPPAASERVESRFDPETLRELSGDKVFARGVAYAAEGRVAIISSRQTRIDATVSGTDTYETELTGSGKSISGFCTCPAFDIQNFCKHMVAVALTANNIATGTLSVDDPFAAVRKHLAKKTAEMLVDRILDLARRDPALREELVLEAAIDGADDETLHAQLKKAITEATKIRDYVEFGQGKAWANGIQRVLGRLETLLDRGKADLVLQLTEYLIRRVDSALGSIDDSNGYCGAALGEAGDLHVAACRAAPPDPILLARTLFEFETELDGDSFYHASDIYEDLLELGGLEEYRRLAASAWATMKPVQPGAKTIAFDEQFAFRQRIRSIMERFAERDDDLNAQIAIRSKDLASASDYIEIVQLHLKAGQARQALQWAEEGLWQFEHDPDDRLTIVAAQIYRQNGQVQEADKLVWSAFVRAPSYHLYERIKDMLQDEPGADRDIYQRAVDLLRNKVSKASKRHAYFEHPAFLLVRLYMDERDFDAAWEVAHLYELSPFLIKDLAGSSAGTHPQDALKAYERLVEKKLLSGGNGNYEESASLIASMAQIRKASGEIENHAAYVTSLMERHKAKRNFIKLMRGQGYGGAPTV